MSTRDHNPEYWAKIATDEAVATRRADSLATFTDIAQHLFDKPLREGDARVITSVTVRVAQYWNDNADDEVHLQLVANATEPLGLHDCVYADEGDDTPLPDDACEWCLGAAGVATHQPLNEPYLQLVPAFEAFCHERGSQNVSGDDACRPYAIARPDGVDVVGRLVRPWLDMPESAPVHPPPHDDLMLALAGNPDAHHALADLLEERGDPRHAAFFGGTPRLWLGELVRLVPRAGLLAERSVPDEIGLYIADAKSVGPRDGAVAFAFRPRVRFLPTSQRTIWPALASARSLGPLDTSALAAIAASPVPFLAEQVELDDSADVAALAAAAAKLPQLRTLRLAGEISTDVAGALRGAKLGGLAAIEIATAREPFAEEVLAWRSVRLPVPVAVAMYDADTERASGWCVDPDGSIAYLGFHRRADRAERERLRAALR